MNRIYFHRIGGPEILLVQEGHQIGGAKDCDHSLEGAQLAPHHCVVNFKNGNVFVETSTTLKSTYLNGLKLVADRKYLIRPGDKLKLGTWEFMVSASAILIESMESQAKQEDIFSSEFSYGGSLSLEGAPEPPPPAENLSEFKKTRRVIGELQETKKQLEARAKQLQELIGQEQDLMAEIRELEAFVGERIADCPATIEKEIEAAQSDVELLEAQIEQNKRVLQELEGQRGLVVDSIIERKAVIEKLAQLTELESQRAHKHHAAEVLKKLNLDEKLAQLNEAIRKEQAHYKELHEEKAQKKLSRHG